MTYAIKISLGDDDWIYITKDNSTHCWDLTPELFNDINDAERFALPWKQAGIGVQIVEYDKEVSI